MKWIGKYFAKELSEQKVLAILEDAEGFIVHIECVKILEAPTIIL